MRLIGVDFGGSSIGLAVMDSQAGIPRALPSLTASGTLAKDAAAIVALAQKEEAAAAVVGLPLDDSGEDTKMARICRQLGGKIQELGLKVEHVDESWTSSEAETAMAEAGLKGSQRRRKSDGEAACRILERWRTAHVQGS